MTFIKSLILLILLFLLNIGLIVNHYYKMRDFNKDLTKHILSR